jgi:murein DD-endopeptidase MepM/ murein hydrolase activator NlpD
MLKNFFKFLFDDEYYQHHRRKAHKFFITFYTIIFILIIIFIGAWVYKLNLDVNYKNKEILLIGKERDTYIKLVNEYIFNLNELDNLEKQKQGINQGIWNTKNIRVSKILNSYISELQSERQEELSLEKHGYQNYKLRYDWMTFPIKGYTSTYDAEFGIWRKNPLRKGEYYQHGGFDLTLQSDINLCSPMDGIISKIGFHELAGYFVVIEQIREEETFNKKTKKFEIIKNKYEVCLSHLNGIKSKEGQQVKKEEIIELMGASGKRCYGRHVDISLKVNGILTNFVTKSTHGNKVVDFIK